MTLRGRLTTAFLAVVLGPALLGAFFVGGAVSAVTAERSTQRLDRAVTAVGTSVGALCGQLHAAAGAVATVTEPDRRVAAGQLVANGLAGAVQFLDATGAPTYVTESAPGAPWAECGREGQSAPAPYTAIAARVDLHDERGVAVGSVRVAQVLDQDFVARLASTSDAAVTMLGGPATAQHTTEAAGSSDGVVHAASGLPVDRTAETADGNRYVRRLVPTPAQPLALVLSVPRGNPQGMYAILVGAVVLAGLVAVAVAWWLARNTTRPIAELAYAADRVAGGDLAARVPVRRRDEVGRLAGAFNRMTREMQAYVQALTASRDQLRGHLAILGDTLSSTHDLSRILQVILQTAVAATGARAGVVLLLDPATGTLVGQCAEGLEERWPAGTVDDKGLDPTTLRVPLGSGLLGAVAASGVPMRGYVDRDGPTLSPEEPRCRTYVALPFAMPRECTLELDTAFPAALGVLALYDRLGSDEFDDSDVTTLRTFAGHAAVAVDNVRMHQEAQRLSLTDPLTGLWNYRYLQESLRREVERASRFGRMLTVLALDLDRFKEVNDTYGHAGGDAVLTEFARRVRAEVREVDLAFRQGGEEFVVLLPETDAAGGVVVAERLGAAIRATPVAIEPAHAGATGGLLPLLVPISVSIGIAVYPDQGVTAQQVLDAADDALYAAKAAGRDTYRVAAVGQPPPAEEIIIRATAVTPADGMPRAGAPEQPSGSSPAAEIAGAAGADPAAGTAGRCADGGSAPIPAGGGAPSGPQPPRQSRGR